MRVSDLAQGIVAVDWRLFPPDKTLAEVGWTPESVVFAAPPIRAGEFLRAGGPAPPVWKARNVEHPDEVVRVAGPTVRDACDQIAATRGAKKDGRIIVLRPAECPRFTDPAMGLPPGADLEFIDSVEAEDQAGRDYFATEPAFRGLALKDWLSELERQDYDRKAFMHEIRGRYPRIK
jgi:hypothetical protein